jgi:hypothetical protein
MCPCEQIFHEQQLKHPLLKHTWQCNIHNMETKLIFIISNCRYEQKIFTIHLFWSHTSVLIFVRVHITMHINHCFKHWTLHQYNKLSVLKYHFNVWIALG